MIVLGICFALALVVHGVTVRLLLNENRRLLGAALAPPGVAYAAFVKEPPSSAPQEPAPPSRPLGADGF